MERLSELQKEIEKVRRELNEAARISVRSPECYQVSLRLDRLLEDYLVTKKE